MELLKPVQVKSVTNTIMDQLEELIVSGGIKVGEKLPSEQELAEQAGVGRRAVREALKGLEFKGLIEVRKGAGAFVVRNDFDNYVKSLIENVKSHLVNDRARLMHVLQFREIVSRGAVKLLVEKGDTERVAHLSECVDQQKTALATGDWEEYSRAHFAYHFGIIETLDNPVVSFFYSQVMELLAPWMSRASRSNERTRRAISEHEAILNAIIENNGERAEELVKAHLKWSYQELKGFVPGAEATVPAE